MNDTIGSFSLVFDAIKRYNESVKSKLDHQQQFSLALG